jgi:hypothetical protein
MIKNDVSKSRDTENIINFELLKKPYLFRRNQSVKFSYSLVIKLVPNVFIYRKKQLFEDTIKGKSIHSLCCWFSAYSLLSNCANFEKWEVKLFIDFFLRFLLLLTFPALPSLWEFL